jgi:hypothetical protein
MAIALWLPRYKQPEETKVKGRGSEVGAGAISPGTATAGKIGLW